MCVVNSKKNMYDVFRQRPKPYTLSTNDAFVVVFYYYFIDTPLVITLHFFNNERRNKFLK